MPCAELLRLPPQSRYVPDPPSVIVCGLLKSLEITLTVPVAAPVFVGVNVTLTVQDAPGASVCGQLFVAANGPVAVIAPIVKFVVEGLLTLTGSGLLVVPTACTANCNFVGRSSIA